MVVKTALWESEHDASGIHKGGLNWAWPNRRGDLNYSEFTNDEILELDAEAIAAGYFTVSRIDPSGDVPKLVAWKLPPMRYLKGLEHCRRQWMLTGDLLAAHSWHRHMERMDRWAPMARFLDYRSWDALGRDAMGGGLYFTCVSVAELERMFFNFLMRCWDWHVRLETEFATGQFKDIGSVPGFAQELTQRSEVLSDWRRFGRMLSGWQQVYKNAPVDTDGLLLHGGVKWHGSLSGSGGSGALVDWVGDCSFDEVLCVIESRGAWAGLCEEFLSRVPVGTRRAESRRPNALQNKLRGMLGDRLAKCSNFVGSWVP